MRWWFDVHYPIVMLNSFQHPFIRQDRCLTKQSNLEVGTFYQASGYAKRWTLKQVQGDGGCVG